MKRTIQSILIGLACLMAAASSHAAEVAGIEVHGFISQGYLKSSDNNFHAPTEEGTFEFNEFGINFSKEVTDQLRMGLQLFSRDLGNNGNNEVTLDWAYGDYRIKDYFGIRVGKIKTPKGLYNETRDVDMLRNSIFLPQSIYPEVLRDTDLALAGGGIYGNVDINTFGLLSYQFAIGVQNIDGTEALFKGLIGSGGSSSRSTFSNIDIDGGTKYSAGLVWDTPLDGLKFSGTWSKTSMDLNAVLTTSTGYSFDLPVDYKNLETVVASVEYTWNDLILVAEYLTSQQLTESFGNTYDVKPKGWYVGASYRFTDWFELGGYYSDYRQDPTDANLTAINNADQTKYLKDFCLTTRFDINEYCCFKLEGHLFNGTATLVNIDNPAPPSGDQWTKDWHMVAAKVTFSF